MFTKGIAKIGGRRRGTPNKLTSTFRQAVLLAYEDIGGHEAIAKWAAENQRDFYLIAAKLTPPEARSSETDSIRVTVYGPPQVIGKPSDAKIVGPPAGELPQFSDRDFSRS
jgi:hypothetical protein